MLGRVNAVGHGSGKINSISYVAVIMRINVKVYILPIKDDFSY